MTVPRIAVQGRDLEMVRLAPGSHSSPREGVCVVELASLLAGEEFSDRPACVCDVIAGYLRSWNDRTGHAQRQRLVPYSFRAIGSGGDPEATRRRRDTCLERGGARLDRGPIRSFLGRMAMRLRIFSVLGLRQAIRLDEGAGEYAARVTFARYGVEEGFSMLESLLEVGSGPRGPVVNANGNGRAGSEAPALPDPVERPAELRVAASVGEFARHAQVAQRENGHQRGNGNGHPGHLDGGDPRQRHEEEVKDDCAANGDPERETNPGEDLHGSPV